MVATSLIQFPLQLLPQEFTFVMLLVTTSIKQLVRLPRQPSTRWVPYLASGVVGVTALRFEGTFPFPTVKGCVVKTERGDEEAALVANNKAILPP